MIGFLVGALQVSAELNVVAQKRRTGRTTEEDQEIRAIIKRRLPEIDENINRELSM